MTEIDWVLVATIVSIIGPATAALLKAVNLVRYIEGRLDSLKFQQREANIRLDSALQLLDYRLRDLEKHGEVHSGFVPHHRRTEETGAPFLGNQE